MVCSEYLTLTLILFILPQWLSLVAELPRMSNSRSSQNSILPRRSCIRASRGRTGASKQPRSPLLSLSLGDYFAVARSLLGWGRTWSDPAALTCATPFCSSGCIIATHYSAATATEDALAPVPSPATAPLLAGNSVGLLRREQGECGAQEGSSGQLYRPTPRDGVLGHTCGKGVQVVVLACHSRCLPSLDGAQELRPAALHSAVKYEGIQAPPQLRGIPLLRTWVNRISVKLVALVSRAHDRKQLAKEDARKRTKWRSR
jgi:hypothetical protein